MRIIFILCFIQVHAKKKTDVIDNEHVVKVCENVTCYGLNVCQQVTMPCQGMDKECFETQPFCGLQVFDVSDDDDDNEEETHDHNSTVNEDSLCNGVTCYGQNKCRVALTFCQQSTEPGTTCRNYQPACMISELEVNNRIVRLM